jgi:hypothetical protein
MQIYFVLAKKLYNLSATVLALCCITFHFSESIRFIEPNSTIPFIDDVPLWLRIEFENDNEECFSVVLNKKYALVTCDEDTLIESKLLPGIHSLELYPSDLPTSSSNVFRHEFQVLEPKDRLPIHLTKDGWSLSLPPCVDEYHKFWYDSGIWYVNVLKVDQDLPVLIAPIGALKSFSCFDSADMNF